MNKEAFRIWLSAPSTRLLAAALLLGSAVPACDASDADPDDDSPSQGGAASGGSASGGAASGGNPSGGARPTGGSSSGGSSAAGAPSSGGSSASKLGTGKQEGTGMSTQRYAKAPVARDGVPYTFIANGWGPGFMSHSVSWNGTSFTVAEMQGMRGPTYQPASYPTVFCGAYSDAVSGACGLPKPLSGITSLRTGWRWKPNGNTGQYNAAYDIWLSRSPNVSDHSAFLMVWLRDPNGQQPAGSRQHMGVTVPGVPGTWNVWAGPIDGKPCISYARVDGEDIYELEFDVMDFVRDVPTRNISMPGTHVLSVAVGFEIWNGPVTNLVSEDFYVDVK
ncbi:MAG TPA: hypothetical protein VER33_12545 [Polyangiaceae bacterium]|nr:hypothetical protein [Polyangiaceae bacterium]